MGFKCNFLDNEIYGADDVSEAFSRLMSSGVLSYANRETVASSLNEMTSELVSDGVTEYSGMAVSITSDGILIGEGTAFFESGVSVTVDENGQLLARDEGAEGYVYFQYEPELNLVAPKFSEAVPEGDTVVLAKVNADGSVTDLRQYAVSKVMLNSKNAYIDYNVTLDWFGEPDSTHGKNRIVLSMPHNGYRYLLIKSAVCESMKNRFYAQEHVFDLESGSYFETYVADTDISTYLTIEKVGTEIIIHAIRYDSYMPQTYEFTLA